jgi:L-lactate dehydrogenase
MPRIAVVGAGLVGSTAAYSILHRGLARELVLIDTDRARAEGEAMDLAHGLSFLKTADVSVRSLEDAGGADLVVLAAGRNSLPGETRMDLLADNAVRIRTICAGLKRWSPRPIVLVVSNPVDVLTELAWRELGWKGRVLGSGTSLDTARLRVLLGRDFGFDPASIHGYVLGEHGDSEFAAWSTVTAGGLGVRDWPAYDESKALRSFERTRAAGYEIIRRKRATYFAIGAAVGVIGEALLRDQRSIYPVSVPLDGQYGLSGVSLSLPCVLGRAGVVQVLEPKLAAAEKAALLRCAEVIRQAVSTVAA